MRTLLVLALITSFGSSRALAAGKASSRPNKASSRPNGEDAPNQQAREKAAKKACATGDYKKGVDILADLYVDSNDPTYVFNQGRCYEQNSRFEQAIERFREFLRKATKLTDEDRAGAQKHIADCEALMPQPARAPAATLAPPTQPAPQPPSPMPVSVSPGPDQTIATPAPPPASSGAGLRVTGLIAAGLGVAALVTAIVLNVEHESLVHQQNTQFSRSRESDIGKYETWSWVGYGAGAALVLAGGITWLLGRPAHDGAQKTVSLLPVIDGRGAGCLLRGEF